MSNPGGPSGSREEDLPARKTRSLGSLLGKREPSPSPSRSHVVNKALFSADWELKPTNYIVAAGVRLLFLRSRRRHRGEGRRIAVCSSPYGVVSSRKKPSVPKITARAQMIGPARFSTRGMSPGMMSAKTEPNSAACIGLFRGFQIPS